MSNRNRRENISQFGSKNVAAECTSSFTSSQLDSRPLGEERSRRPKTLWKLPKIIPRDTRTSLQRKKLAAGPELCANPMRNSVFRKNDRREKSKTFVVANSIVYPKSCGSPVVPQLRCSSACKVSPVCAATPRIPRNYACVDSATEKMVSGLEAWLNKRGKPLICTNLKEVSTSIQGGWNSAKPNEYTRLLSPQGFDEFESKENVPPETKMNKRDLLSGALEDLKNLISMGFPIRDSEEWLVAIKSCYNEVTCEPLYWECLALLRNATTYQTNVREDVDGFAKEVEELEKKFETLDIASPAVGHYQAVGIRDSAGLNVSLKNNRDVNPGNVMASNEIYFAVQENKKEGPEFVVTPVRRNKRSRKCENKDKVCSSYFKISEEIRKNAVFKPNHSLDF